MGSYSGVVSCCVDNLAVYQVYIAVVVVSVFIFCIINRFGFPRCV
jgi:hypothetical protein